MTVDLLLDLVADLKKGGVSVDANRALASD